MARRAQGRKPARGQRSSLAPWLSLAAAAHACVLALALANRPPAPTASRAPVDAVSDPLWLDLVGEGGAPERVAERARLPPDAAPEPPREASGAGEAPNAGASLAGRARETLGEGRAPRDALRGGASEPARDARGARGSAPVADAEHAPVAEGAAGAAPAEASDAPAAAGEVAGSPGAGPRLSLRELGVERGQNPFIGSYDELPTERQLHNQRLRQSLRSEIAKQDQARGLGPEGPAVRAVTDIVMASASAPNTSALLRVRANGAGVVTLVDVLEADRDAAEWQRIAAELVRALAGKKLRVPAHSSGVSFQLRVVSRVQLPSGADPGLAVDVLGIPVKKGDGERSSKISIASPMIKEVEVPGSNGLRVPVVSFAPLGFAGDPVDIGAVARRLVTAYLVAMDTEILPESAASAAPAPAPSPAPAALP